MSTALEETRHSTEEVEEEGEDGLLQEQVSSVAVCLCNNSLISPSLPRGLQQLTSTATTSIVSPPDYERLLLTRKDDLRQDEFPNLLLFPQQDVIVRNQHTMLLCFIILLGQSRDC